MDVRTRGVGKVPGHFTVEGDLVVGGGLAVAALVVGGRPALEVIIHVRAFDHPAEVNGHAIEQRTGLGVRIHVSLTAIRQRRGAVDQPDNQSDQQDEHRHSHENLDQGESLPRPRWRVGCDRPACQFRLRVPKTCTRPARFLGAATGSTVAGQVTCNVTPVAVRPLDGGKKVAVSR